MEIFSNRNGRPPRIICIGGVVALTLWLLVVFGISCSKYNFRQTMVNTRDILFSISATDTNVLSLPPSLFIDRTSFVLDDSNSISAGIAQLTKSIAYFGQAPHSATKFKGLLELVRLFSREGGPGCGSFVSLHDLFSNINRDNGRGCCSDHVQALMAIATQHGYFVREVHSKTHTTAEFWDTDLKQWVWLDPLYAFYATNETKQLLSLSDLFELAKNDQLANFVNFGIPEFHHPSDPAAYSHYRNVDEFKEIRITLGNNVYSEDRWRKKLNFLPKPVYQFVGISLRFIPMQLRFFETRMDEHKFLLKKYALWGAILLFIVLHLVLIAYFFSRTFRSISRYKSTRRLASFSHE